MGEYILKNKEGTELPREVFYQCIWIVKDMDRLKQLSSETERKYILSEGDSYSDYIDDELSYDPVGREAAFKIDCIYAALSQIPEEYRALILNSIRLKQGDGITHENTVKQWKQRFVYYLARELRLI